MKGWAGTDGVPWLASAPKLTVRYVTLPAHVAAAAAAAAATCSDIKIQ
jgi:hypothetical protein